MAQVAELLKESGDLDAALAYQRSEAEGCWRRFGPTHERTLIAQQRLVVTLWKLDQHDEAKVLQLSLLERCARFLGKGDHHTLVAEDWLGHMEYVDGNLHDAQDLLQRAVVGYRKLFGATDPNTLHAQKYLDAINTRLGGSSGPSADD